MRDITLAEQLKLKVLTEYSVALTLIEPTETGLKKSIMDATGPVRNFLAEQEIHDYNEQGQGQQNKYIVEAFIVAEDEFISSNASLYRPETKKGDPRIWFSKLNRYAAPNDILALIVFSEKIYVLNLTQLPVERLIYGETQNPFQELVFAISSKEGATAEELLYMLRQIAARGPIPAEVDADTAVGRTLETALGIGINSSRQPDYKGIELKSFRDKRRNRKTLFAQVPDWKLSKLKSSSQILDAFGYRRGDDLKLYCTVSAIIRNSQGLRFRLDADANWLLENSDQREIGDFAVWGLNKLHERLLEKHKETFWIAADSTFEDGKEYFQYRTVEHTKKPITSQFDILLEQGIITMDHLIKRNRAGRVSEKGPLFKIKPNGLDLLFPASKRYELTL